MKKITLLFILLSNFALFAQQYEIQIRLVDAEVGYPTGDPIGDDYDSVSNDPGLNAIFQTYNATHYYPNGSGVPDWNDRTHHVTCNGCDINGFEQALDNYPSVIERTDQTPPGTLSNGIYSVLVDVENGYNTGNTTSGGIVITNNNVLNAIFVDYTVLYYEQAFPDSQNPDLLKVFELGCDCQVSELMPILNAETDIIDHTTQLSYAILNTMDSEKQVFAFYPNPVGDRMTINSSEKIISYEIINPLGQSIYTGNSEISINNLLPSLAQGTYLLKVDTDSGKTQTLRFIKK